MNYTHTARVGNDGVRVCGDVDRLRNLLEIVGVGVLPLSFWIRSYVRSVSRIYPHPPIVAALVVSRSRDRSVSRYNIFNGHGNRLHFHLSHEFLLAFQQCSVDRVIPTESHQNACRHGNTVGQWKRRSHSIIRKSFRVSLSTYCVSIDSTESTSYELGLLADHQKLDTSPSQGLGNAGRMTRPCVPIL